MRKKLELTEKQKLEQIIANEKAKRVQEFGTEFEALIQKYNVTIVPQMILTPGAYPEIKMTAVANG
jgi:hypothetical protein